MKHEASHDVIEVKSVCQHKDNNYHTFELVANGID